MVMCITFPPSANFLGVFFYPPPVETLIIYVLTYAQLMNPYDVTGRDRKIRSYAYTKKIKQLVPQF